MIIKVNLIILIIMQHKPINLVLKMIILKIIKKDLLNRNKKHKLIINLINLKSIIIIIIKMMILS